MKNITNHNIKHIGFILDGNGRWAKKRGLSRSIGHKMGLEAVRKTIDACIKHNIKHVSLYCFSTENWKRERSEVKFIFDLLDDYISKNIDNFIQKGVCIKFLGDKSKFDASLQEKLALVEDKTKGLTTIYVNVMLNYGARDEIVRAINLICQNGLDKIDYETLTKYLYTKDIPDPDLIVRTSGEQRLSNFLLLQSAYSELYFPKVYWPSFSERWLKKCIKVYNKRNRRFGNA